MEQPLSAMSWDEDFVSFACQEFLVETAIFSHCNVCESHEIPLAKDWKFVANIPNFSDCTLPCTCLSPHRSFAGKRDHKGEFLSKQTAEYPPKLAKILSSELQVQLMKSAVRGTWSLQNLLDHLPRRAPLRTIHIPDGAGLASSALWPIPFQEDVFQHLRKRLEELCYTYGMHRIIKSHIAQKRNESPFTPQMQTDLDGIFRDFFVENQLDISFETPPDQPFRLFALEALAKLAGDPDANFVATLVDGVDLGVSQEIQPSGVWPLKQDEQDVGDNHFQSFTSNWASAETDDETLEKLIQKEIADGFVVELPSLAYAKEQFGDLFAIGKLGIATQQVDKPRLVLDSTISGLNPASNKAILEKYSYPKLTDLQRCLPSSVRKPNLFLNIDVKSAHKRIKVRRDHQGLLAFRSGDKLYHYKVLHFGGSCSAYYWTRVAGILLRCVHRLLFLYHSGMVFVDDFIFSFSNDTALLQASIVLMLMSFLHVPLSWNKLELKEQVTWIGWDLNTVSDTVSITQEKTQKIISMLRKCSTSGKFLRKDVEKLTGTILWISEMFPHIRWILGTLYTILSRPGLQLVRLTKDQIQFILENLSDQGILMKFLPQPFVPQGSILQRLGKFSFQNSIESLKKLCFDCSYAWTTFLNCRSNRVQILEHEAEILRNMIDFFSTTSPCVALSQTRRFELIAGADAFADKDNFGLGAWLQSPAGSLWCSITGNKHDIGRWISSDSLQSHILAFEMIAQLLVLILFRFQEKFIRGQDIFISTRLDNQAAEAILQQGFTQLPIPAAITKAHQILTFQSRTFLQPFRASSAENVRADDLSRGRILQEDPQGQLLVDITVLMEAIFSDGASHLARLRGVKR